MSYLITGICPDVANDSFIVTFNNKAWYQFYKNRATVRRLKRKYKR